MIPFLTKAHILANQWTNLGERLDDIKCILDTNTIRTRSGGEVLASSAARDIENHDTQMICQLLLGIFLQSQSWHSHRKESS